MATVNVSLDTKTRQAVLMINGVIIPADNFSVHRDTFDGEVDISFSYTIESVDANGMKERRRFFLPSREDVAPSVGSELNEDGFASKIVHNDDKAKADIIDFFQKGRNPQ